MNVKSDLTVIALAWRETDHLEACFKSLAGLKARTGAATLIVLDDDTDDTMRSISKAVADRVIELPFESFSRQRNNALDAAATEWVFFIDPDERCTRALAREIERALTEITHNAYRVPRRNILFGREVKHTGWWPDYQVRLLRRDYCRYDEAVGVHERPVVEGSTGTFASALIHYNYKTWAQFAAKQKAYARLEAQALLLEGRRAKLRGLLGQPARELKRRFIEYQGYKDGMLGLALSLAMALYSLEVHRQLLALQRKHRD